MNAEELQVLELTGSPYERGLKHGGLVQSLINESVLVWKSHLGTYGGDKPSFSEDEADQYIDRFLKNSQFEEAIKTFTPDLYDETRGVADGADISLRDALCLQLLDEEWLYGVQHRRLGSISKCTAFGVPATSTRHAVAGQNMDIGQAYDGLQVVLRIASTGDDPEALVFSTAGCLGLNGVNSAGVGITCNALPQLAISNEGLPVAFVVRGALAQSSVEDAVQFVTSINHASGQNYILSSAEKVVCLECSANDKRELIAGDLNGAICHTNHPLVSDDFNKFLPEEMRLPENSIARLSSVLDRFRDIEDECVLAQAKKALSSHDNPNHPVSRIGDNAHNPMGFTAGSSIYDFGTEIKFHVAPGPPCKTTYRALTFSK